jgi:hypothetical protein
MPTDVNQHDNRIAPAWRTPPLLCRGRAARAQPAIFERPAHFLVVGKAGPLVQR